jgi:hypothetical protein
MMRDELKESNIKPEQEKDECRHYWIIESAQGPVSRGFCKFCGAEKEFHNSWPGFSYAGKDARVFDLPELFDAKSEEEPEDAGLEKSGASL